ncbi:MAG: hypothetical protein ACI9U2_004831, partial [Bradymonadia bacterium]
MTLPEGDLSLPRRMLPGIALMFGLLGCAVDTHQRCDDDPTGCPSGFYCGVEWCYPEGTGPGLPDAPGEDASSDANLLFDMAADMPLDTQIGDPTPDDGRLSGAVSGRDAIRVRIDGAAAADFALVEVGADCADWIPQQLAVGELIIESPAWDAFSPEGSFDLCIRVGALIERRGAFVVDEVSPTLKNLDLTAGITLRASEPLSGARLSTSGCMDGTDLAIGPDDTASAPASGLGDFDSADLVLVDLIGNSVCARLVTHRVACIFESELTNDAIPPGVRAGEVIISTCSEARPTGRLCVDCTELVGGPDAYEHLTIVGRHPRFAVPHTLTTRPGSFEVAARMQSAVRVSPTQIAVADQRVLQIWTYDGGQWLPGPSQDGFVGIVSLALVDSSDAFIRLAIGQSNGAVDVVRVEPDLINPSVGFSAGGALDQVIDLTSGLRVQRLATRAGAIVSVHAPDAQQILADTQVTRIAPIWVGEGQLVAYAAPGVVGIDPPGPDRLSVAVPGDPTCLMAGDWTGNGRDELVACVGDALHVFTVDPDVGAAGHLRAFGTF